MIRRVTMLLGRFGQAIPSTNFAGIVTDEGNIVSQEQQQFLLSVPNWKTLNNTELRSLILVSEAIWLSENDFPDDPFQTCLEWLYATPQDLAVWHRVLPERALPE